MSEAHAPVRSRRFFSRRYWLNLLGFTLLVALVMLYVVLPVALAWTQTRPLPHAVPLPAPLPAGWELQPLAVAAADGTVLRGWYLAPRNGAVIILYPGYGGDRRAVLPYAEFLARAGFGLLMMDPRATGESDGEQRAYGWSDWGDGTALVEALLQRPEVRADGIGAFGCSTGAEIALGAAALEPRIRAAAADAPYYAGLADISFPVTAYDWLSAPLTPVFLAALQVFSGARPPLTLGDATAAVAQRPLLLIAGGQSENGFEARQAEHFYAQAGAGAELWVIAEAGHCGGLAARPEEYVQRVVAFFEAGLGP